MTGFRGTAPPSSSPWPSRRRWSLVTSSPTGSRRPRRPLPSSWTGCPPGSTSGWSPSTRAPRWRSRPPPTTRRSRRGSTASTPARRRPSVRRSSPRWRPSPTSTRRPPRTRLPPTSCCSPMATAPPAGRWSRPPRRRSTRTCPSRPSPTAPPTGRSTASRCRRTPTCCASSPRPPRASSTRPPAAGNCEGSTPTSAARSASAPSARTCRCGSSAWPWSPPWPWPCPPCSGSLVWPEVAASVVERELAGARSAGELEVGAVDAAVDQLDDQLAAAVRPGPVGLPDVDVGVGPRVVQQHAERCGQGRLDGVDRRPLVAGDLLGRGVAGGHHAEPLEPVQAEAHRHPEARPHRVAHRQVVDRRLEPGEVEQRAQGDPHDLRVVVAGLGGELRVHVDRVVGERLREQRVAQQDVVERLRVALEVVGVALVLRQGLDQVVPDARLQGAERRRELEVVEVA